VKDLASGAYAASAPIVESALGAQGCSIPHRQPLSLLLVEDDRADAVLVQELIADAGAAIRLVWAQSIAMPSVSWRAFGPTVSCWICSCRTPAGWTL
jgi:hypothetical protein